MTRRRKAKLAAKTGKVMLDHPAARRAAAATAMPIAKRRLRTRGIRAGEQIERYGEAVRGAGSALAEYAPSAADALTEHAPSAAAVLGLQKPPRIKRTGPRVAAGFVIGVVTMYMLDPSQGGERRSRLMGAAAAGASAQGATVAASFTA
jgi:hypothetical protein